jgi:hypothetical protein
MQQAGSEKNLNGKDVALFYIDFAREAARDAHVNGVRFRPGLVALQNTMSSVSTNGR